MKTITLVILPLLLVAIAGCGGGTSSVNNPPTSQGASLVSISLHDMPPAGVTVLSFQATMTGISMQPGNVSLLSSPITLEMTQLQAMSAYLGSTMGGMMGGGTCANDQICQSTPTMMASSVNITGSPFPVTLQSNTPVNMQMDFDLMDSMQSNMSMNPVMTSTMQQQMQGSGMFDEVDDMIGQVSSVNAANNQFTISFVQGMPAMTISVDNSTTFQDFDSIEKPNTIAGLSQGQIVLSKMQLMAGGTLHATKVRFESNNSQVIDGMIVAINSPAQFDMVLMNEAPAFQGVNSGDVIRMNLQAGTMFDVDDIDMPVSGMSFAGAADLMVGQIVQIEPTSALVSGVPPQLNTTHMRLMKTWLTAKVASKIDASTFSVNNLPGMFGSAGFSTMKISTSMQTGFENVSGAGILNVGDTVSVRGPMFIGSGSPTIIASKVLKR